MQTARTPKGGFSVKTDGRTEDPLLRFVREATVSYSPPIGACGPASASSVAMQREELVTFVGFYALAEALEIFPNAVNAIFGKRPAERATYPYP